ncbi:ribose 5-phosphate isomerase B [bacterium]|nr:MAG: ribose 5-phosphate isomerase B [candidate division KSB1 bacterium]MCE7943227.1 ribose 5-phosphate isomerase B [Chlorobi bacterium CHB1]MCL4706147.1 ribose 5-phosphate isomerase B [bacterium]MDL1876673.1 ribose 5-phosphate isomerase B [Cytophagia bacterium CHB2]MBC6946614.1 ribose 5-phosphate isomerase B [candidate division KSB1 bacterium]
MPVAPSRKSKQVLTERDILQAWKERKTQIIVPTGALVTPAARDAAKVRKIALISAASQAAPAETPTAVSEKPQLVVIGSDHAGYQLKEQIKTHLRDLGYRHEDVGAFSEASVDYPDIAELVAQRVAGQASLRGIIIDGAGIGSTIAANKVPGIRAAACFDTYTTKNSREHNNTNVLCLGSRNLGSDIAKEIVTVWLATGFGGGRHQRRIEKIAALEQKYLRNP